MNDVIEGLRGHKKWIVLGSFLVIVFFGLIFFRGCCVTFVDNYELGYRYDLRSGQISRVGRTGYILHPPIFVEIHNVDLRPMQVCINANARVLNCKLVQFNPVGLETFLSWHGRKDYNGANSSGTADITTGAFNSILMSYAFDGSGKSYPFLTVIRELKPEEAVAAPSSSQ
jgi:hypothetical protein